MEHSVCYPLPQDSWGHAPSIFQKILFQSHATAFQPKNSNSQWVKPCQVRCILYHSRGSFDHSRAWQRTKGGSPRPWVQSHLRYWRRCPPKPAQAQKINHKVWKPNKSCKKTCRNVRNLDKSSGHVFFGAGVRTATIWHFQVQFPGHFASRNASRGWYPKRAQAQRLLTMSCAQLEHRMDLKCPGFLYPFRS